MKKIVEETPSGSESCRSTLNYIIVVLGKYLQMIVSYHIHKGDLDVVEEDFRKFNMNYHQLAQSFYQVTGEEFLPEDANANKKGLESEENNSEYRPVVAWGAGGAGGAMAAPDFGISDPFSTKSGRLSPLKNTGSPGFSDLPTALEYECKECSAKDDQIRALQKELRAYKNLSQ